MCHGGTFENQNENNKGPYLNDVYTGRGGYPNAIVVRKIT